MDKMFETIAYTIAGKIGCYNITKDLPEFAENKRYNPYNSELNGIYTMMKIMDIPYEFEFAEDYSVKAVIVAGHRVEVKNG